MGDKMHSRFKILAIFVTVVIVVLSALTGLAFAADNSFRLAAALPNITKYLSLSQCWSYFGDLGRVAFLFLLVLWRLLFLRKLQ